MPGPVCEDRELNRHGLDFAEFGADDFDFLVRGFLLLLGQLEQITDSVQIADSILEAVFDQIDLDDEFADG